MATRSQRGAYWQLENGKYFVPTVDQVGGWNPEAPMVDANGRLMADERGNLIPMSAPQQPFSVRDAKGAWLAKGDGGTPYTYTGVLPGFGGSTPASISGTLYDSPLSESYVASNIEGGGLDMPGLSIIAPYFGATFGPSLFGNLQGGALAPGESAVAGSGVWSGGNPIGGGGMWDWLDSIMNGSNTSAVDPFSFDPSTLEGSSGGLNNLSDLPPATNMQDWMTKLDSTPQGKTLLNSITGGWGDAAGAMTAKDLLSLGRTLSGIGGLTGAGGSTGRGIFDQIQNDPLGSAFNATPFLLALAQAKSQANDLNGVLSKINGEGYTNAVLHPYDLATGQGRTALEQSLSDRGVAGSSFGYNDLNNYDYLRNLGRGDLANKAQMTSAGLEGSLINQRNTNTNLLLGAGLNASGQLFSPKKDPFGLGNLGLASLLG